MGNEARYYAPKVTKFQLQNELFIDLLTLSLPNGQEVYQKVVGKESRLCALATIEGGEALWDAAKLLSTVLRIGELHPSSSTPCALSAAQLVIACSSLIPPLSSVLRPTSVPGVFRQTNEPTGTPNDGWAVADGLDSLWTEIPFKYGKKGKPSAKGQPLPYNVGDAGVMTLLEEPSSTCKAAQVLVPGSTTITMQMTARQR